MEKRRDEYLAKAMEAEELAEKAMDAAARESWLKIAAGYYALARPQST